MLFLIELNHTRLPRELHPRSRPSRFIWQDRTDSTLQRCANQKQRKTLLETVTTRPACLSPGQLCPSFPAGWSAHSMGLPQGDPTCRPGTASHVQDKLRAGKDSSQLLGCQPSSSLPAPENTGAHGRAWWASEGSSGSITRGNTQTGDFIPRNILLGPQPTCM